MTASPAIATTNVCAMTRKIVVGTGGNEVSHAWITKRSPCGSNIGGGAKIRLVGPLRLRLDYRVFNLHGSPKFKNPQRFYAGINLSF